MKKSFAALTAGLMLIASILPTINCAAIATSTPKEEVVYVNLAADGSVNNIDVVNIFNLSEAGEIIDYGNYSSVRNMTSTEKIDYTDQTAKISAKSGKLYYDGRLANNESPWKVEIKYLLDGKEMKPDKVAGLSGHIIITLKVSRNDAYTGPDFYRNYALQGSIAFDTTKVQNIVAKDATIANVGQDKQLTYIALPGKGIDTVIEADVKDFETDGFSINGLPLSLNIKIDDSELMSQVRALQDGITKVDDGSTALNNGLQSLKSGLNKAEDLVATGKKYINPSDLQTAINASKIALEKATLINEKSAEIIAASQKIRTSISQLTTLTAKLQSDVTYENFAKKLEEGGISQAKLQEQNNAAIKALQDTISSINEQITALEEAGEDTTELKAQIVQLNTAINALRDNNAQITKSQELAKKYIGGINSIIGQLNTGAKKLQETYDRFDEGLNTFMQTVAQLSNLKSGIEQVIAEYERVSGEKAEYTTIVANIIAGYNTVVSGTKQLINGSQQLNNGTHQLRAATANLDGIVSSKIDDILASIQGEAQIGSFVSKDNTSVSAVQFVIKSAKIAKPVESKATKTESKDLSLWERIINLFK